MLPVALARSVFDNTLSTGGFVNGVMASCNHCNGAGTHDVMFVSNIFTRVQHRPCIFGSRFKCIKQRAAPVTVDFVIWHCAHSMRNSLAGSIKRSSVRLFVGLSVLPSVCLSYRSIAVAVRRVCCWAPRGQEISIDSRRRHVTCGQWHVDSRVDEAEHRLVSHGYFREQSLLSLIALLIVGANVVVSNALYKFDFLLCSSVSIARLDERCTLIWSWRHCYHTHTTAIVVH